MRKELLPYIRASKNIFFLISFILFYFLNFSLSKSQTIAVTDGIILNSNHRGGEVKDISRIILKPGFYFKAEKNQSFHGFIVKNPFKEHFSNTSKIIEDIMRFNSSISKNISLIEFRIPNDTYNSKLCFSYDESGNYISTSNDCTKAKALPIDNIKNIIEVVDYTNLFFVTPNPTGGLINIIWDKEIISALHQIHIVPFNGSNSLKVKFKMEEYKTTYDLTSYPKGIYFIEFILKDGQKIAKKIIKL